ncbi:dentin sialophosphoprotein-like [Malaya genurostris]|uniref:dentin sialophosphoprotein-like n=1 Tax=Malaya genurostris TaxID=325434 RepID=UPI0026F3AA82|nr:dentin sialophosphoprotein-like [Malaya genurostris]
MSWEVFLFLVFSAGFIDTKANRCSPRCVSIEEINTLWANEDPKHYWQCDPVDEGVWNPVLRICAPATLFSFRQQTCVDPDDWEDVCMPGNGDGSESDENESGVTDPDDEDSNGSDGDGTDPDDKDPGDNDSDGDGTDPDEENPESEEPDDSKPVEEDSDENNPGQPESDEIISDPCIPRCRTQKEIDTLWAYKDPEHYWQCNPLEEGIWIPILRICAPETLFSFRQQTCVHPSDWEEVCVPGGEDGGESDENESGVTDPDDEDSNGSDGDGTDPDDKDPGDNDSDGDGKDPDEEDPESDEPDPDDDDSNGSDGDGTDPDDKDPGDNDSDGDGTDPDEEDPESEEPDDSKPVEEDSDENNPGHPESDEIISDPCIPRCRTQKEIDTLWAYKDPEHYWQCNPLEEGIWIPILRICAPETLFSFRQQTCVHPSDWEEVCVPGGEDGGESDENESGVTDPDDEDSNGSDGDGTDPDDKDPGDNDSDGDGKDPDEEDPESDEPDPDDDDSNGSDGDGTDPDDKDPGDNDSDGDGTDPDEEDPESEEPDDSKPVEEDSDENNPGHPESDEIISDPCIPRCRTQKEIDTLWAYKDPEHYWQCNPLEEGIWIPILRICAPETLFSFRQQTCVHPSDWEEVCVPGGEDGGESDENESGVTDPDDEDSNGSDGDGTDPDDKDPGDNDSDGDGKDPDEEDPESDEPDPDDDDSNGSDGDGTDPDDKDPGENDSDGDGTDPDEEDPESEEPDDSKPVEEDSDENNPGQPESDEIISDPCIPRCRTQKEIDTLWAFKDPEHYWQCNPLEEGIWIPVLRICAPETIFSFRQQTCVHPSDWEEVCVPGGEDGGESDENESGVTDPDEEDSNGSDEDGTDPDDKDPGDNDSDGDGKDPDEEDPESEEPDPDDDDSNGSDGDGTDPDDKDPGDNDSDDDGTDPDEEDPESEEPDDSTPVEEDSDENNPGQPESDEIISDPCIPRCRTQKEIDTLWAYEDPEHYWQCVPLEEGIWIPVLRICAPETLFSFRQQTCVHPSDWEEICVSRDGISNDSSMCPAPSCHSFDDTRTLWALHDPHFFLECISSNSSDWVLRRTSCAAGTWFNFHVQACVFLEDWKACASQRIDNHEAHADRFTQTACRCASSSIDYGTTNACACSDPLVSDKVICGVPRCQTEQDKRLLWPGSAGNSYYRCVSDGSLVTKAIGLRCPEGRMFDWNLQRCVPWMKGVVSCLVKPVSNRP